MRECDDQYPWLGEFLTEYVDGTMDPASRAAFEECLRGNAALVSFVERLRVTRNMLCDYGCDVHAPCNLREQLHARLMREGLLTQPTGEALPPPPTPSGSGSPALRATLVLLACAMGATLFAARTALDAPAPVGMRVDEGAVLQPAVATTFPISARLPYGEARVATRADSVRRAQRLAEASARMAP